MEKRKFKRVGFVAEAVVRSGEFSVKGTVSNLSMKGMFVQTSEGLPGEGPLDIEISLSGSSSRLVISATGKAVRRSDEGIGIQFTELDLDSFMHLKNVVAYNSDDADAIEKEYFDSLDF